MSGFSWSVGRGVILAIGLFLSLSVMIALAETQYWNPIGTELAGTTYQKRQVQLGDYARGSSSAVNPIGSVRAEVHAFSNDPGNWNGGWALKDAAVAENSVFATTPWVGLDGYYSSGFYGCDVYRCYSTTQHLFYRTNPYYTSTDGGHSSWVCFNTPGC